MQQAEDADIIRLVFSTPGKETEVSTLATRAAVLFDAADEAHQALRKVTAIVGLISCSEAIDATHAQAMLGIEDQLSTIVAQLGGALNPARSVQ